MFFCKNKCHNYTSQYGNKKKYSDGYKKYTVCEISVKTEQIQCFCCHAMLRSHSKKKK